MAAITNGTAHFFGIGATLTNATIQSISPTHEFNLEEPTANESGITIETRRDDRVKRVNVTMRLRTGYAFPNIGSSVTLASLADNTFNDTYVVVDKGQQYANRTHLEQTLTLEAYEGITY
jgi:hypothetical protein